MTSTASSDLQLELLASAAVVFRYHLNGTLDALPHVVALVSAYLDFAVPEKWSIESACEKSVGLRMLERLAAREPAMDQYYHAFLAGKGLVAAVRNGDLDVVRWICSEYCPSVVPVHAMIEAAKRSRLHVLRWLFERYPSVRPNIDIVDEAVKEGHLDVLRWVFPHIEMQADNIPRLLYDAPSLGHLKIVRWLHEEYQRLAVSRPLTETYFGRRSLGYAILNGHFEVARFLTDNGYQLDRQGDPANCAKSGDLEMIQWMHARGFTQGTVGWINAAAAAGHLHVLKWVAENIPSDVCSPTALSDAARRGHLEIVQWLHTNRPEVRKAKAMDHAATGGHLEVLQWLHANLPDSCSDFAMNQAAARGHLEVVQWLHEHRTEGCTTNAMDQAAERGHLEVVRWLHANRTEGCTTMAMNGAARNGNLEIVEWLHENRTEGCSTEAMDWAAANGFLDVVRWLHANRSEGCTVWAMDSAAKNEYLHVVKWLHQNRSEGCSTNAMDGANSLQMLQWLHEHRSEGCTRLATEIAAFHGNFDKLLFLKEKNLSVFSEKTATAACRSSNFEILQWLRANYPEHVDMDAIFRMFAAHRGARAMFLEFELGHRDRQQ